MKANNAKICYIISSFHPLIGGAERATQTLSQGLITRDWDVRIITAWHRGLPRRQVINSVGVHRCGAGGPGKLRSLTFGLCSLFYIFLRARKIPLIHVQNIDTPLLIGILLRVIANKRLILTIHSDQVLPQRSRTLLGQLRIALMRRWVDHFVAISSSGRDCMLQVRIPPDRISLIPNGLDIDFFRPPSPKERAALREKLGYFSRDVVLLYLGRLVPSKRVDLLLSALDNLRTDNRIKCLIVGDGPQRDRLQAIAQELSLQDRVHFVGAATDVRDFYWLSDLFVQPSQFEGLSVALLESMACGLAVVASNCRGNLELVSNRSNGLTFPVDDEQQLTNHLAELVDNLDLRTMLGAKASSEARSNYGKEFVTQAHLEIYQQVLRSAAR